MENTSYELSFRVVFFYLVVTGWIFYISLCENSINSINEVQAEQYTSDEIGALKSYSGITWGVRKLMSLESLVPL